MLALLASFVDFLSYYFPQTEDTQVIKVEEEEMSPESEKEVEPFDVGSLPPSIFLRIVEKLNFRDLANLEETSQFAAGCINGKKFPILHCVLTTFASANELVISWARGVYDDRDFKRTPFSLVKRSGVKILTINMSFEYDDNSSIISSSRLQEITAQFNEVGVKVYRLVIKQPPYFDPDDLLEFIKATQLSVISFEQFVPRRYFERNLFDTLQRVNLHNTGFTDKELLSLKTNSMAYFCCTNDFVTARGLNQFLKQWTRGEREIDQFVIDYDTTFNFRLPEDIIQGVNANPIWTPALHRDSLIAKVPIEEFELMEDGDPQHMYALWRSDKIFDYLILDLQKSQFRAYKATDPDSELLYYLTYQQYYEAIGVCKQCETVYCEHWRRYSTNTFKKIFPKTWKSLMSSIKLAKWVTTFLKYSGIILNSNRVVNRPKMEYYRRRLHEENPQNVRILRYWIDFEFLAFHT